MILFPTKKDCCACGACLEICPKGAISMHRDEDGFMYPQIDPDKCIDCGLCQKVCAYQHIEENKVPLGVYAGTSMNTSQIRKSASGGIFAAIATKVLEMNGVVYGAVMDRVEDRFVIYHKGISSLEDLHFLQGSKYVQSNSSVCFKEIRSNLNKGKLVLFSGTPCQCAGLRGFLRKDYSNLFVIDIICHGVPSQKFFNDYINFSFCKLNNIQNFVFRDKTKGWGLLGRIYYDNNRSKSVIAGTSSYYSLFLSAQIYRENCHSCKYASEHRVGDITIGDYWGIQREHPELLKDKNFSVQNGISCIIVNSEKGKFLLEKSSDLLRTYPSEYAKVANLNFQLIHPTKKGVYRDDIFRLYRNKGYEAIEKFYRKKYVKQRIIHSLLGVLPSGIKSFIYKIFK